MKSADNIKRLFKKAAVDTHPDRDDAVFAAIRSAFTQSSKATSAVTRPVLWRIVMNSNLTKFTAVTMVIAVCVMLWLPNAYALSDSIKAYHSIQWLRIEMSEVFAEGSSQREIWFGCDEQGSITSMRLSTEDAGDPVGPLIITQTDGHTEAWLARHNLHLKGYGSAVALFKYDVTQLDPRYLLQKLAEQERLGNAIVQINESKGKRDPIVVTVTYPQGSRSEDWKKVFTIDQATNLVIRIEQYDSRHPDRLPVQTLEFFDYNLEIDPAMFTLAGEVSADARVVDMSHMVAGMIQGSMTDEEVATRITREFFEAAMTEDFDRAGQLYLGAPGFLVEKAFEDADVFKILSVGEAHPSPNPDSEMMLSSAKILAEVWGDPYEIDAKAVCVQRLAVDPNRWLITGMLVNAGPAAGPLSLSPDHTGLNAMTYDGLKPFSLMQKWLVLDPIVLPGLDAAQSSAEMQKQAFDDDPIDVTQFSSRVAIGDKDHAWSLLECEYGVIDLSQLYGDSPQYTYVWSQIDMPAPMQGILGIGSDDGVKVWVNGELIHQNWIMRGVDIDSDRVLVTFKQGMNQLVLKIHNQGGPWGFCCQLRGD